MADISVIPEGSIILLHADKEEARRVESLVDIIVKREALVQQPSQTWSKDCS